RCGLDAHPALSDAPEEACRIGIEAKFHCPVGRKGPETSPFALDGLNRPIDCPLETVDRGGDVDLFRGDVARLDLGFVQRADPNAVVALALEIEALMAVGDERDVAQAGAADPQ